MRKILVLGAGKSSPALIKYFAENAGKESWLLTVADSSLEIAKLRIQNYSSAKAIQFDITNEQQRGLEISTHDIVISLLPPSLHIEAAKDCIRLKKHLVTASYVSKEMKQLDSDAKKNNVLLLNECGLDPGIDHMSAMKIIDDVKSNGAELISFKSYCGGLIAPESNDNPWGYKFTWNPRNVILAGQGTARYIENGQFRYIPYSRLFQQIEKIKVDANDFEGYANRDSLEYKTHYVIENIPTLLRGTLRNKGFCSAWNIFVQMGLTDDAFTINHCNKLSYIEFTEAFLPEGTGSAEQKLQQFILRFTDDKTVFEKIKYTGLLENKKIPLENGTPAQIFQQLLEEKWKLRENDLDMIVMTHRFQYKLDGKLINHTSDFIFKGENSIQTAMAKTVGLPLAIAAKNILNGKIKNRGVVIPVHREIYTPVLNELKNHGIDFKETITTSPK